jgi:hypothetical protein
MPDGDDECQSDKPVTVRCSDGSTAESMCPTKLPYCDQVDNSKSCYDRKDIDQSTGLYPCDDGTQKADYKDCEDVTESNNEDSNSNERSL